MPPVSGQLIQRIAAETATTVGAVHGTTDCVDASTCCADVLTKFNSTQKLAGVIVQTEAQANIGLISRQRMLEVFALPYRSEVYAKKPIGAVLAHLFPPTVPFAADTLIHEAVEIVLKRATGTLMEPMLVVSDDGAPSKVVEVHSVLMALLALQERQFVDLQRARDSLVQAEKLASLGGLVAGVAHEINTPLGVSLSAASFLSERLKEFNALVKNKQLRKTDLDAMVKQATEASDLILHNMGRAHTLIQSFKRVSADQTSEVRRKFDFAQTLDEVLRSVSPSIKHQAIKIHLDAQPGLLMDSYPGAIAQIVTNLLQNTVLHAFADNREGTVQILAKATGETGVSLEISDNGCGMDAHAAKMAFEPFFTTKRNEGGTGLGLHIVHNLVVNVLGGVIELTSQKAVGTRFAMHFPRSALQASK
jgi:signal transduction histidine kinase